MLSSAGCLQWSPEPSVVRLLSRVELFRFAGGSRRNGDGLLDTMLPICVAAAGSESPSPHCWSGSAARRRRRVRHGDMTDTDVVSAMMEEFREFSPGGAQALIDERDAYIAHRLVALRQSGHHVVAVVGAGHREGIERYLKYPERSRRWSR